MSELTLAEMPTIQPTLEVETPATMPVPEVTPEDDVEVVFTIVKHAPVAIELDLHALTWDDFVLIQQASEIKDEVAATKQLIDTIGKVTPTDLTKVPMQVLMKIVKRVMDNFQTVGNPKN